MSAGTTDQHGELRERVVRIESKLDEHKRMLEDQQNLMERLIRLEEARHAEGISIEHLYRNHRKLKDRTQEMDVRMSTLEAQSKTDRLVLWSAIVALASAVGVVLASVWSRIADTALALREAMRMLT